VIGKKIAERTRAAGIEQWISIPAVTCTNDEWKPWLPQPGSGVEILSYVETYLRETLAVRRNIQVNANNLKDQVVAIQRVTKVVKAARISAFGVVVVGDQQGKRRLRHGQGARSAMASARRSKQGRKT